MDVIWSDYWTIKDLAGQVIENKAHLLTLA